MIYLYITLALVILVIILYLAYEIIFNSKLKNVPNKKLLIIYQLVTFLIVIITSANLLYSLVIHKNTLNKRGPRGERGIPGIAGEDGNKSRCHKKCGKKSCINLVDEYANEIFRKITKTDKSINNIFFINKINLICSSDSYQDILYRPHKNKPAEIKLINYIKNIVEKWVRLILSYDTYNGYGSKFLLSSEDTDIDWESELTGDSSPFNEIRKYDIWKWTEPTVVKKILRRQCLRNSDLPESDDPPLKVMFSNEYKPVYNGDKNIDKWGPRNCPFGQLGLDNTNPSKKSWCWSSRKRESGQPTWITNKRHNSKNPVSLYTVNKYVNETETEGFREFYPLGSVWRSSNNYNKPKGAECYPPKDSSCSKMGENPKGPEKRTILVSGDVKSPLRFNKIWDSREGCVNCQKPSNYTSLWEPVPPKGYTCLGDVAVKGGGPPNSNSIKCVPSKCVDKIPISKKVWDNKGLKEEQYGKPEKLDRTYKPKTVSIWASGMSENDEDKINRPDLRLKEDGGYNLFRANDSNFKPPGDRQYIYTIKDSCFKKQVANQMDTSNMPGGFGYPKKNSNQSISTYTKTIPVGIITNYRSNRPKKYYLEHSGNKEDENSYFIKAYNFDFNNFSNCLTVNNDTIIRDTKFNANNMNQVWEIEYILDSSGQNKIDTDSGMPLVKMRSKSSRKCFHQSYGNRGFLKEKLTNGETSEGPHIWVFKSIVGDIKKI